MHCERKCANSNILNNLERNCIEGTGLSINNIANMEMFPLLKLMARANCSSTAFASFLHSMETNRWLQFLYVVWKKTLQSFWDPPLPNPLWAPLNCLKFGLALIFPHLIIYTGDWRANGGKARISPPPPNPLQTRPSLAEAQPAAVSRSWRRRHCRASATDVES